MIRYNSNYNYSKSRLLPVMLACTLHLGWGTVWPTSAARDGLPQPYSELGSDYKSYIFRMASGPISTSHQLILVIDIVCLHCSTWVIQFNPGLSWFMNNTIISYESHLITIQIRSGFYIYILERSFCLMLYNIAMIHYHSRCVIRQFLWLRLSYPNAWFRLGFYMYSLQELCANWLIRHAHDRSASEAREQITRESPDNRLRHILLGPWGTRGILMYTVFPRNLYSTECHTSTTQLLSP